jgi:hypothetical protein
MKTMTLLFTTLLSSLAFAGMSSTHGDLTGYYSCGPQQGVVVYVDMATRSALLKGQSRIAFELIDGGVSNGVSNYVFQGIYDGKPLIMTFGSVSGPKVVRFKHPSGTTYSIACGEANKVPEGF